MATTQWQKTLEIPGRVLFSEGNGELARLQITTAWSNAEVYLHGAQITHFERKKEPPVLFMSQLSRFNEGSPIRGGIPIIFPWFGPREGQPAHGFARTQTWELREVAQTPSGGVSLRLSLPDSPSAALFQKFSADFLVTIGKTLEAELIVANLSPDQDFTFENCLHTYFAVGDISAVSVTGLKGVDYLDQTENFTRKTERAEHIKISQETDRIYLNTTAPVEIHDSQLAAADLGLKNPAPCPPWYGIRGWIKPNKCRILAATNFTNDLCRIRQRRGKPGHAARRQDRRAQSRNQHLAAIRVLPKGEGRVKMGKGCGCGSMVECGLPKAETRVRFPSPAPLVINDLRIVQAKLIFG